MGGLALLRDAAHVAFGWNGELSSLTTSERSFSWDLAFCRVTFWLPETGAQGNVSRMQDYAGALQRKAQSNLEKSCLHCLPSELLASLPASVSVLS